MPLGPDQDRYDGSPTNYDGEPFQPIGENTASLIELLKVRGLNEVSVLLQGVWHLANVLGRDELKIPKNLARVTGFRGKILRNENIKGIGDILINRFDPLDDNVKIAVHEDLKSREYKRLLRNVIGGTLVGALAKAAEFPVVLPIIEGITITGVARELVSGLHNGSKSRDEKDRINTETWDLHLYHQIEEAAQQTGIINDPKAVEELALYTFEGVLKRHAAFEKFVQEVEIINGQSVDRLDLAIQRGVDLDRSLRIIHRMHRRGPFYNPIRAGHIDARIDWLRKKVVRYHENEYGYGRYVSEMQLEQEARQDATAERAQRPMRRWPWDR